ncbi:hypothetical protein [Clavibacter michiganensis]|nr:hypothetical protein [Clavibacter michiganensis]
MKSAEEPVVHAPTTGWSVTWRTTPRRKPAAPIAHEVTIGLELLICESS